MSESEREAAFVPGPLDELVPGLRKKLDPENTIKPIETVRGRGYRFAIARSP
jgi:two-component system response regulator PhoP